MKMRMTLAVAFALCALLAVSSARILLPFNDENSKHLPCSKECIKGPEYWCQNLTTSACCGSTWYCIPRKWEHMQVPEDHDSVCDICKNMVQQARDQLESNQTQNDLKMVFEGTCALIHIKPIVEECDKMVDQFVPDLVETLASQMNPSVVCSVAGLCNSAHIDKLLEEYKDQPTIKNVEGLLSLSNDEFNPDECSKCYTIAHHMEDKLNHATRDQVLERFLNICGEFSSFSDACSSIVLTHFETIYNHLKSNFNTNNICHLSGQCSARFHVHEDENKPLAVEVRPLSSVGVVEIGDDLPCKLCEQLVGHLRDLLVANTTETEFQQVLHGLCKQTKSFATECAAIVDEYYPQIYEFLTKNLDGNAVCQMASLCPAPGKMSVPMWPLVSQEHADTAQKVMKAGEMQLPIDRLTLPGLPVVDDTYCSTCEFVLNHLRKNVRNTKNKDEIKLVLGEIKGVLPNLKGSLEHEEFFLGKYEEALTELISEGKDFSEICSLVAVCPTNRQIEAWKQIPAEFTVKSSRGDHNCPLCQLAVTKIYDYIQDNRTEESILSALDKLCIKLMPKNLKEECMDLVKIYSKELIQMLLKDMSAEEICEYLKFCEPKTMKRHNLHIGDKIAAVPKNNVEGKEVCALCEYVLHFIQQAITDPKAEDQVTQVVKKVCKKLPESVQNDCDQFVDTYGSALVAIIAEEFDPSQVCPMIHVCPSNQLLESYRKVESQGITKKYEDKSNCPLCLFGVTQLYSVIKNNKTKESIEAALEKLCTHLPKSLVDQCDGFVRNYSTEIIDMMIADFTPEEVCVYLKLCDPSREVGPKISFFPLDKDGQIMTNEIPDYPTYEIVPPEFHPQVKEDTECVICEQVMAYMEKILGTHKSKEEIEQVFHEVCDHLPRRISAKCNNFVNDYGEIVIELLTQEVSPKEICTIVGMCKSDTTTERLKESVTECAVCQSIVTNIDNYITSDHDIKDLDQYLYEGCKKLPANELKKCVMILEAHEQNIVDMLSVYGSQNACSKLSLCSSNDFLLKYSDGRTKRQTDDKNLEKTPCAQGVSYWCLNNQTAEECQATQWCKKFGHLNEPSTSTTVKPTTDGVHNASVTESLTDCAMCQSIVTNIEKYTVSDQGKKDLDQYLYEGCKKLPASELQRCVKMLMSYLQRIINIIMGDGSEYPCNKLALCSSNDPLPNSSNSRTRRQTDDKNLGTKPCTWGVSYWCVDNQTAEECKATEWCKKIGRLNESSTSTTVKPTTDGDHELASEVEQAVSEAQQSS